MTIGEVFDALPYWPFLLAFACTFPPMFIIQLGMRPGRMYSMRPLLLCMAACAILFSVCGFIEGANSGFLVNRDAFAIFNFMITVIAFGALLSLGVAAVAMPFSHLINHLRGRA
jgi:hypothetical protein